MTETHTNKKSEDASPKDKEAALQAPASKTAKNTDTKADAQKTTPSEKKAEAKGKEEKVAEPAAAPEPDNLKPRKSAASEGAQETQAPKAQETRPNDRLSSDDTPDQSEDLDLEDRNWSAAAVRIIFMIAYGIVGWFAFSTALALAAINVIIALITGKPNPQLTGWIKGLGAYICEIIVYLSCADDKKPFPLDRDFPDAEPSDGSLD